MAKKILVIDDEPDLLEAAVITLKEVGFEVVTALDGEEGLKKALEEKPDLILLDLILPKMDGFKVIQELRYAMSAQPIPVIILTAFGTEYAQQRCEALEVKDFINKPYDSGELIAKINALIGAED